MNTTSMSTDSIVDALSDKPGSQLNIQRELCGYTQEYVASKLHLRVRIIELLEADDYKSMPEPVFIKGYLRAYAKLLGVDPEPLMDAFNQHYSGERKLEKALWQSRRQSNKAEHAIRWVTMLFGLGVMVAVAVWWQNNKENQPIFTTAINQAKPATKTEPSTAEQDIRLTDLSKMRSLLSSSPSQDSELGTQGD